MRPRCTNEESCIECKGLWFTDWSLKEHNIRIDKQLCYDRCTVWCSSDCHYFSTLYTTIVALWFLTEKVKLEILQSRFLEYAIGHLQMWYNDTVHLNELSRLLHKRWIVCVGLENKASICKQVCLRFVQQGELVYWTGGRTMSLRYQAIWIIDLVHREPRAGACHIHNRHRVKEWKIRPTVHLRTLGSPNVGLCIHFK